MLIAGQDQKIIKILVKIMKDIHDHLGDVEIDENDLGTTYTIGGGHQPDLDDKLKRWSSDSVGTALREGVKAVGEIFIPLATKQEVDDIIDEVARRSPNSDHAHAIMNHKFDSITTSDGFTFMA